MLIECVIVTKYTVHTYLVCEAVVAFIAICCSKGMRMVPSALFIYFLIYFLNKQMPWPRRRLMTLPSIYLVVTWRSVLQQQKILSHDFFWFFFDLIIFIIINFFCSSSAESAASSTALLQVAKFLDQILSICNRLELSILWYMVHNMPYKDATAVIV